jgi:CSLREA domain-containing protein
VYNLQKYTIKVHDELYRHFRFAAGTGIGYEREGAMKVWRGILVFLVCAGLVAPVSGWSETDGTTIFVDSLADNMTVDGKCTLREAMLAANLDQQVDSCPAGQGADTIMVLSGTIKLAVEGPVENEGLTGDLDIYSEMQIVGAGSSKTIIDANKIDRVFDVGEVERQGTVTISDMTIRGGNLDGNLYPYPEEDNLANGGGVRLKYYSTTLKLVRVDVTDNYAGDPGGGNGGGIYSVGRLEIYDSVFTNNRAFYTGGALVASREVVIDNSDFYDNYGYGEAVMHLNSGARVQITRSTFSYNHCGPAGWTFVISQGAELTMQDFKVEYNDCDEATLLNYGSLTLADGLFARNSMGIHEPTGGGVIVHQSGELAVKNVTFAGNQAPAAILVNNGHARIEESLFTAGNYGGLTITGGSAQVINSTFSTTRTGDDSFSAGVLVEGGFLVLESVTLANLQSEQAALQVNGGTVTVHNALLAYNTTLAGVLRDCQVAPGTTVSAGYNLISVSDGCGWRAVTGDRLGRRAAPLDPLLGRLTDNGPTRTKTQPPLPGSPAIDTADPQVCPPFDQRGFKRPQGPRCDIGAHEAASTQPIELENQYYLPMIQR